MEDLFTQKAVEFLKKPHPQPFLLYLAYTSPHADNERGAAYPDGIDVPSNEPYTTRDWPDVEKSFAAFVTRLDRDVGTESRIGSAGQQVNNYLNGNGNDSASFVKPYVWVATQFDANGKTRSLVQTDNIQIFPSYQLYANGLPLFSVPQGNEGVSSNSTQPPFTQFAHKTFILFLLLVSDHALGRQAPADPIERLASGSADRALLHSMLYHRQIPEQIGILRNTFDKMHL